MKSIFENVAIFDIRISRYVYLIIIFTTEDVGIEVKLHKKSMVRRLLNWFPMEDWKPISTLLLDVISLGMNNSVLLPDATTYRQFIGSLQHLGNTVCPDTSCATSYLLRLCITNDKALKS